MNKIILTSHLQNPNVSTVILGATKPEQVVDNCGAIKLLPKLTDDVMKEIESILANKP
jgi:aryl-alcohol dehydrogenase-like predicted oxidoreductase